MVSFPPVSPSKTLYAPLSSPIRATCPAHLILLDFITRTILGEEYKSFSSSLCSLLHSPVTSPLLGPNILLNTIFSNTLSFATYFKKWNESVMFKACQVTRPSVWTCLTVKQIYKTGANSYFRPHWKIVGHLSFTKCKDHCWQRYVLRYMVNSFLRGCLQKIMSPVGGRGGQIKLKASIRTLP